MASNEQSNNVITSRINNLITESKYESFTVGNAEVAIDYNETNVMQSNHDNSITQTTLINSNQPDLEFNEIQSPTNEPSTITMPFSTSKVVPIMDTTSHNTTDPMVNIKYNPLSSIDEVHQTVIQSKESKDINESSNINNNVLVKPKAQVVAGSSVTQSVLSNSYMLLSLLAVVIILVVVAVVVGVLIGMHKTSNSPNNLSHNTTNSKSHKPTKFPTYIPTKIPTKIPTLSPLVVIPTSPTITSKVPTRSPSCIPTLSPIQTNSPSVFPSKSPTVFPSKSPTVSPSLSPVLLPTISPGTTYSPTTTILPSVSPTISPTSFPSYFPTIVPIQSNTPTILSSSIPTLTTAPTPTLTTAPTISPTISPTANFLSPSVSPTNKNPTFPPTKNPTALPSSKSPTEFPTRRPTGPTFTPTPRPTNPTGHPTGQPTRQPTSQPTTRPSRQPTSQPTRRPTGQPTSRPSRQPTSQPTTRPTRQPTARPSRQPTTKPSRQPTSQPSSSPTTIPTSFPYIYQASFISCGPNVPTKAPTKAPTTSTKKPLPKGWAEVVNWTYGFQYAYDQKPCNRYAIVDGVIDMKVYRNDSPHQASSNTKPRTELRVLNSQMVFGKYTYLSDFRISCNTYGVNIFQIFDTTGYPYIELRTYDRKLYTSGYQLIYPLNICSAWRSFNATYNGDTTEVFITVNGKLYYITNYPGLYSHEMYFKQGVYTSSGPSVYMEIFLRNIHVLHYYKY